MNDKPGAFPAVPLPRIFLDLPLAHRGLHDLTCGVVENSLRAAEGAIAAGHGIELDVQLSKDGVAMVFHDADLARLTDRTGLVKDFTARELSQLELRGGQGEGIPTLAAFLEAVAGRAPVLVELKDQTGCFGPETSLATSVAAAVTAYAGPVAVMSFNPHSVAHLARLAPDIPRGLTTKRFLPSRNLGLAQARSLSAIEMFDQVGASFISHDRRSLKMRSVADLRAKAVPVLTWTVYSAREETEARKIAHNITFEGYLPDLSHASG